MNLEVVILAAGKGTRMCSAKPKVLHQLAGQPLLGHVINTAKALSPKKIHVVCGHQAKALQEAFSNESINWVYQEEQLGTGHALLQCLDAFSPENAVIVLSGDVPLLTVNTLEKLASLASKNPLSLLTAVLDNPTGLGRVLRNDKALIMAIREDKDCSEKERAIAEIYSGIMIASVTLLQKYLPQLSSKNAQKEYYLTEIIEMAVKDKVSIGSIKAKNPVEVEGVNTLIQLEDLERKYQKQQAETFLAKGVILKDKSRFDVRGDVCIARDVIIDVNVILEGKVIIEENVQIGPNCIIKDAHLKKGAVIYANSMIDGGIIGELATVGPFARVRPGTELAESAKIGNFVEVKKTYLGQGAKANHLSYVGDATVGNFVNIGAGTITCNYDGVNKHQTEIGDNAFIGSGTQLVAPIKVGSGATIGAGTTLRRDAPQGELTLSHSPNKTVRGWQRPQKKEKPVEQES